ncbi:MAG: GNAT family N-acetyltransferase [Marinilabiliaceae bacterium]|nr:GNAT family N-acetyltransferase [Marinilabiliaceae bacterium]
MTPYIITPFSKKYLSNLFELCRTTIEQIYSALYDREVVNYFLSYNQPENILSDSKIGFTALVFSDDNLIGSGCLLENNIRRIFVLPKYQRAGIGTKIVKCLEQKAIENSCSLVDLFAMMPTIDFYEKMGYSQLEICNYKVNNNLCVDYMKMFKNL